MFSFRGQRSPAVGWARPPLIALIIGALAAPVQILGQDSASEARIRERVAGYWQSMQDGRFESAAQYVVPESRDFFLHRITKSRVQAWKIRSITVAEDGKTCEAVAVVRRPMPPLGESADWPVPMQWVVQDGEWYYKLPWKEGESPLLQIFKAEEQSRAKAEEATRRPPASPPLSRDQGTALAQRLVPDAANPKVVHFGEKVVFKYHYENTGTQPFKIVSVQSDCHCADASKVYDEVPPGGEGTLEVTLDTFGLPVGRIEKIVQVQFSDLPETIQLAIAVDSRPNFSIEPSAVDFGDVASGGVVEKSMRFVNDSGRPVKILSWGRSDTRLECSPDRLSLQPGEAATFALKYSAGRAGEFRDNLLLHLDLPAEPIVNVRITGRVMP